MGFFKDFKDDVSQAVNELMDDAVGTETKEEVIADDVMVDTLDDADTLDSAAIDQALENVTDASIDSATEAETADESASEEIVLDTFETFETEDTTKEVPAENAADPNETAIITPGLKIKGDIESTGSIELLGTVTGNVTCQGKLSVSGTIEGNTHSASFFSNKAEIRGNISCEGVAKLGNGSVVIGDLSATSAVIAGAIKGDIDVHGPVILDTTAIVMGDIKSAAVQINNGAVIEGHCSQCYAENSPSNFFKDR